MEARISDDQRDFQIAGLRYAGRNEDERYESVYTATLKGTVVY
jgi:hypothetical protein